MDISHGVFVNLRQNNNNNNRKFGQNTKTPKLAKCGLAKCGQHFETLILARCALAKCGHENKLAKFGFFWPNAVLAKCGLAKCGHDHPPLPLHLPKNRLTIVLDIVEGQGRGGAKIQHGAIRYAEKQWCRQPQAQFPQPNLFDGLFLPLLQPGTAASLQSAPWPGLN